MINRRKTNTSVQRRRISKLQEEHKEIQSSFRITNFYENRKLNLNKLKKKIQEGKKHLKNFRSIQDHTKEYRKRTIEDDEPSKTFTINKNQSKKKTNVKGKEEQKKRPITQANTYYPQQNNKTFVESYKAKEVKDKGSDKQIKIFPIGRRHCWIDNEEKTEILNLKNFTQTNSQVSLQSQPNKIIILDDQEEVDQFQMKVRLLWELYQTLVELMQSTNDSSLNQGQILMYLKAVGSNRFAFISELCGKLNKRTARTIRLSRMCEAITVFELCVQLTNRKKIRSPQLVNLLGFSSSSIAFLIKILLLTHKTSRVFSEDVQKIIQAISNYELATYKKQITQLKEIIREIQHNNEIFSMLKGKYLKRINNSYTQQFINFLVNSAEKYQTDLNKYPQQIFEFLAFFLHQESIPFKLPALSIPPTPFVNLKYSRTIIIQPWDVLVVRKSGKLFIRANTGHFIEELSQMCNIIFWTEAMPKQSDVLIELFPSGENIFWLYRYHCFHSGAAVVKKISCAGCMKQNTILIDNKMDNFKMNQQIGIIMKWKGEKKDVKLLMLLDLLKKALQKAQQKQGTVLQELKNVRDQINKINKKTNRGYYRNKTVQSK